LLEIRVRINGAEMVLSVKPTETLLDVLRESLGMKGTKRSCNQGECGACTVLLDGKAVNSCLVLAASINGCEISTIEGLAQAGHLDPIQESFIAHDASQCGFCTPGMIMSAKALLSEEMAPSLESIKTALAGNLCRCTGYQSIIKAVQSCSSGPNSRADKTERV
jgi:aerobic carbon-monoxide dehydrogenase small subunit